jgi:hypothetical protein
VRRVAQRRLYRYPNGNCFTHSITNSHANCYSDRFTDGNGNRHFVAYCFRNSLSNRLSNRERQRFGNRFTAA